jgi:large subunit ribosomal protein L4
VFDAPSTKRAADMLEDWLSTDDTAPARLSTLVLLSEQEADAGLSFRNLRAVDVMPVADAGVADVIGAATLLVSETALEQLVARAAGSGDKEAA